MGYVVGYDGIKFPATQVPSSNANTLDDYKEGAWTPTDASGAGLSLVGAVGSYEKIGRLAVMRFALTFPATADGTAAKIGGLPFTLGATADTVTGVLTLSDEATAKYISGNGGAATLQIFDSSASALTNATLSGNVVRGFLIVNV